jgi:hypothetical protein
MPLKVLASNIELLFHFRLIALASHVQLAEALAERLRTVVYCRSFDIEQSFKHVHDAIQQAVQIKTV